MVRVLVLASSILVTLSVAHAADLDGVSMPDMRVVNGTQMHLDGIGLRTFSVLGIRIYVAGLYFNRRCDNPDAILHPLETKLLRIRFLRNLDAAVRHGWPSESAGLFASESRWNGQSSGGFEGRKLRRLTRLRSKPNRRDKSLVCRQSSVTNPMPSSRRWQGAAIIGTRWADGSVTGESRARRFLWR
jgi:hypothetical protein